MIDKSDTQTVDLFQSVKRRGRPVTGHAKTPAERMRAYRQRLKASGKPKASSPDSLKPVLVDLRQQLIDALTREIATVQTGLDLMRSSHASLKEIHKQRNLLKSLRNRVGQLQTQEVDCGHV